ncbi:hypothetical protein LV779_28420 [Streptomyces thinghirensis]|nr:hypothetical protein [Streptomyces thinghirensis]
MAREELEERRARTTATSALPGYESAGASQPRAASPSAPLYEPAERLAPPGGPRGCSRRPTVPCPAPPARAGGR